MSGACHNRKEMLKSTDATIGERKKRTIVRKRGVSSIGRNMVAGQPAIIKGEQIVVRATAWAICIEKSCVRAMVLIGDNNRTATRSMPKKNAAIRIVLTGLFSEARFARTKAKRSSKRYSIQN